MAQMNVKFFLFKSGGGGNEHVLAIRVSHAQYDGLSLKPILKSLESLYALRMTDSTPVTGADYAAYTRECAQLQTQKNMAFWTNFLQGSSITYLPLAHKIGCEDYNRETLLSTTRELSLLLLPPGSGITMATFVKAAWSYVLAMETKRLDLLFGQIINCRSINLPQPGKIIGPCFNVSPIRVQDLSGWKVKDLLQHIQDQHARVLEYATNQWGNIARDCTSWPRGAEVGSVVLHENFDMCPSVTDEERTWQMTIPIFSDPPERIVYVTTTPEMKRGENMLSVMLSVSNWVMQKDDIERLAERLCEVLEMFGRDVGAALVL